MISAPVGTETEHSTSPQVVFDEYSRYYDLLYADKDYVGEAAYVLSLLDRHHGRVRNLVEFGSGTGRHGRLIASRGIRVAGIERSETMISRARENDSDDNGGFSCELGDVRRTRAPGSFDAVAALFHVVSYQTSDDDVQAIFTNAAGHLAAGGVFLFDAWHAPAVLATQPTVRVKRMEDELVHITRIAEPTLKSDANCVEVSYTLFCRDKRNGRITTLSESHLMRYFSTPEIRSLAKAHGFEVEACEEWLTGASPSTDTWGVCYVLRKCRD